MKGGARVVLVPSPLVALVERWAVREAKAREEARAHRAAAFESRAYRDRHLAAGNRDAAAVHERAAAVCDAAADGAARLVTAWNNAAAEVWDVIEHGGA